MTAWSRLLRALERLDREPAPDEPVYDPAHLGGVLVCFLAAAGALYWLLWTALVFEGGAFLKAAAAVRLVLGRADLAGLGYEGPWERGAFEGAAGSAGAVVLIVLALLSLRSEWRRASRARR